MEIINVDRTQYEDFPAELQLLANQMPTSDSRRRLEAWIERHFNQNGEPLVLVNYDRRDDGPGFKIVCVDIDTTFVF